MGEMRAGSSVAAAGARFLPISLIGDESISNAMAMVGWLPGNASLGWTHREVGRRRRAWGWGRRCCLERAPESGELMYSFDRRSRSEVIGLALFDLDRKEALVVAPHADDEVLAAGGLIARLCGEGWNVRVLYGVVSGFTSLSGAGSSITVDREAECLSALTVLGCTHWDALYRGEEAHLRLDTVPQAELIQGIESHLELQRPSLAVIPSEADHHQDHRAMARACVTALRPAPEGQRPRVPLVLAYGQSGAAGWGGEAYRFDPVAFVDISAVIEKKLEAMACYASQLRDAPHGRSLEGIRARAAVFGALGGCAYAEGFECLRYVA